MIVDLKLISQHVEEILALGASRKPFYNSQLRFMEDREMNTPADGDQP